MLPALSPLLPSDVVDLVEDDVSHLLNPLEVVGGHEQDLQALRHRHQDLAVQSVVPEP